MPKFQTSIGVITQKIDNNTYIVSANSRYLTAKWNGDTALVAGDRVVLQKVDVSKLAHIISLSFGDIVEGGSNQQTPSTGAGGSSIGSGGDSSELGVHSSGTATNDVFKDFKYGFGPLVVPYTSASSWMRIYGQNSTPGTVQVQGAVYANSGGSIGTVGGIPGSLLGTTTIISIAGSQPANWYIGSFVPNINLNAGIIHLAAIVGGTTFKAGYGTSSEYNRWGPTADAFSDGPSDPAGSMGTTLFQFAAITINMDYVPLAGGFLQFDVGPSLDASHLSP